MPVATGIRSSLLLLVLLAPAAGSQGLPTERPEKVGLSTAGLARVDSAMRAYVTGGKLAGIVVAVAKDGRLAHWKAFGLRSVEAKDPMEPSDLFRIYSMTKPITSTAVMILVEDGKLGLDDPVAKHLPEFAGVKVWTRDGLVPPRRHMTVRDLLRHTSGLTYGFFGQTPVDSLYRAMPTPTSLADLIAKLAGLPLVGHPGEVWSYSYSTDVLGRIVEVVSGQSLDRFFEERIFVPLKMRDSFFQVPADKRSRLTGHYALPAPGRFVLADSPDTGNYTRPAAVLSGGGGLVSTAADYLRFAQMILNGGELDGARVLQSGTVVEMLRNQLAGEMVPAVGPQVLQGTGFGLGFNLIVNGKDPLRGGNGTASWAGIANTYFFIDPNTQLIGLVLTQFSPFGRYPIEVEFRQLVNRALR
ncbi:MAG: serine hydrolase domain-containing protein [Gemmatimonadales bacterium]